MNLTILLAVVLPFLEVDHAIILREVYLNGIGPFTMLLDTGAQSSALTPAVAARVGMKPAFRVEQVTASGSKLALGGYITIQAGEFFECQVETIISDLSAVRQVVEVDGVLGQSWLQRHSYEIDFVRQEFRLDRPPSKGNRVPIEFVDSRPAIRAEIDGSERILVLDSGCPGLVLFGTGKGSGSILLSTNTGSAQVAQKRSRLLIQGASARTVQAITVPQGDPSAGLLGFRMFRSVYVNPEQRYAILR